MGMPPVWGVRMRCHRGRDCSFRGKSESKKSPKLLAWVNGGSWVCIMHRNREHLRKADLGREEGSTWDVVSLCCWGVMLGEPQQVRTRKRPGSGSAGGICIR